MNNTYVLKTSLTILTLFALFMAKPSHPFAHPRLYRLYGLLLIFSYHINGRIHLA